MEKIDNIEELLVFLLDSEGLEVLKCPAKINGMIIDYFPSLKKECGAIKACLDRGFSTQLYEAVIQDDMLSQFEINQIRSRYLTEVWMSEEAIDYVMDTFINALKKSRVALIRPIVFEEKSKQNPTEPVENITKIDQQQNVSVQSENSVNNSNSVQSGILCGYCGAKLFHGKPFCPNCGNRTPYASPLTNTSPIPTTKAPKSVDQQIPSTNQNSANSSKTHRYISFSLFSDQDKVEFYMDGNLVGNVGGINHVLRKQAPLNSVKITMSYGRNLSKRGNLVLPADGYDYMVFGGRPGNVVHKLCALPLDVFDNYINSICNDINQSRLRRWIKLHTDDNSCVIAFYDHFEFVYDDNDAVPDDGQWYFVPRGKAAVKYSRNTKKLMKQIPIRRKQWDALGYLFCIRLLIYKKLKDDYGYNIKLDGTF